jgi:hypothetical protein
MGITTETKTVYTCSDGKSFTNEDDALRHEKKLEQIQYFEISFGADTIEGRNCLQNTAVIAVNAKGSHRQFAEHAMYKALGSPYAFVQGCFGSNAILPYWEIKAKLSGNPGNSDIIFRVEERFAENKIFGEGIKRLLNGEWVNVGH